MAVLGPCQAAIVSLGNVLGGNFPRVDNAGTMYALLDAQNRNTGTTPDPTSGRNDGFATMDETDGLPIVYIRHYQRDVEETRTVPSCDGPEKAITKKQFKITMYRETAVKMSWKYMAGLCGEAAKVFASGMAPDGVRYNIGNTPIMADLHAQIMSKVYKLVEDISTDLATKLATKAGVNRRTGTTAVKNYNFWKANGDKNSRGYNELLTDYQYAGFGGTPIVIGGAETQMFANEMRWGNFAASGTDYSKMAAADPFRFYLDKNADTIFGQDNFLAIAPGIAKLVTYNEFGGNIFNGNFGTGEFGQFTIPEFGNDIRFDLHVEKVSCPKPTAVFIISLYYDVYTPEDIFKAYDAGVGADNDPNAGVNGIIKGKVTYASA